MNAAARALCGVALVLGAGPLVLCLKPVADAGESSAAHLPPDPQPMATPVAVGRIAAGPAWDGLALQPTRQQDLHAWRAATQAATAERIPDLRQTALTAPHPTVVGLCLAALGRLDAVAGDPDLLALAHDPRPRVRQDLVVALGQSQDPRAVDALRQTAEHGDAALRPLLFQALGRIGGEPALAALRALAAAGTASPTEAAFLRTALRCAADPHADAPAGPRGIAPESQPATDAEPASPLAR